MTHQVEIEFKTLLTREEYQRVFAFYQLDQRILFTGAVADRLIQEQIDPAAVKPFAELTTRRAEFSVTEGLLALDESWYGQSHDYELELEVSEASSGKRAFLSLLDRLHISYRPAKNKIIRALEEKLSKKEYE